MVSLISCSHFLQNACIIGRKLTLYLQLDDVVGTDKRFNIKARNNRDDGGYFWRTIVDLTDWGLGQREYEDPYGEVSVSFVITGSELYKYHHSLNFGANDAW